MRAQIRLENHDKLHVICKINPIYQFTSKVNMKKISIALEAPKLSGNNLRLGRARRIKKIGQPELIEIGNLNALKHETREQDELMSPYRDGVTLNLSLTCPPDINVSPFSFLLSLLELNEPVIIIAEQQQEERSFELAVARSLVIAAPAVRLLLLKVPRFCVTLLEMLRLMDGHVSREQKSEGLHCEHSLPSQIIAPTTTNSASTVASKLQLQSCCFQHDYEPKSQLVAPCGSFCKIRAKLQGVEIRGSTSNWRRDAVCFKAESYKSSSSSSSVATTRLDLSRPILYELNGILREFDRREVARRTLVLELGTNSENCFSLIYRWSSDVSAFDLNGLNEENSEKKVHVYNDYNELCAPNEAANLRVINRASELSNLKTINGIETTLALSEQSSKHDATLSSQAILTSDCLQMKTNYEKHDDYDNNYLTPLKPTAAATTTRLLLSSLLLASFRTNSIITIIVFVLSNSLGVSQVGKLRNCFDELICCLRTLSLQITRSRVNLTTPTFHSNSKPPNSPSLSSFIRPRSRTRAQSQHSWSFLKLTRLILTLASCWNLALVLSTMSPLSTSLGARAKIPIFAAATGAAPSDWLTPIEAFGQNRASEAPSEASSSASQLHSILANSNKNNNNTTTLSQTTMTDDLMSMPNHHKAHSSSIPWRIEHASGTNKSSASNDDSRAESNVEQSKPLSSNSSSSNNNNNNNNNNQTNNYKTDKNTPISPSESADPIRLSSSSFWADIGQMARIIVNNKLAGHQFSRRSSPANRYESRWTRINVGDTRDSAHGRPQSTSSAPSPTMPTASIQQEMSHSLPHLRPSSSASLSSSILALLAPLITPPLPNLNSDRYFPADRQSSSSGGGGGNNNGNNNDRRRQDSLWLRRPFDLIQRTLNRIGDRIGARNSIRVHNAFRDFAWRLLGSFSMPTPIIYELRRQNFYSPLDDSLNDAHFDKNTTKTIRIGRQLNRFFESLSTALPHSALLSQANNMTKTFRLKRSLGQRALEHQLVEQPDLNFNNGVRERFRSRVEDLIRISRNRPLFGRVIRIPSLLPFRRRREEMPSYQTANSKRQQQVAINDKTKNKNVLKDKTTQDEAFQVKPAIINHHPIRLVQLLPPTASLINNNDAYADSITKTTIQQHKITRKTISNNNNNETRRRLRIFSRRKDNKSKLKDPSEDHQIINIDGKKFYLDDENDLKPLN